ALPYSIMRRKLTECSRTSLSVISGASADLLRQNFSPLESEVLSTLKIIRTKSSSKNFSLKPENKSRMNSEELTVLKWKRLKIKKISPRLDHLPKLFIQKKNFRKHWPLLQPKHVRNFVLNTQLA